MVDEKTKIDFMEFLKSKQVAVISTVSSDGQPESATIYFIVKEHFTFYFMTKNFSRKYKNLETNPHVALVIGTENTPVTAQIQGTAEKITDPAESDTRLKELMESIFKNDYVAPLFQMEPPEKNEVVVYKITPSWIRWLDLRSEKEKVTGDFVQILP